jgi:hypothetical protein
MFYRPCIEGGVDTQPCHQVRVGPVVEIIPPEEGSMIPGNNGVKITVIDAIAFNSLYVPSADKCRVLFEELPDPDVKILFCHGFQLYFRNKYNG